jgi:hypothetical protein
VGVGSGEADGERDAIAIHDEMVFGARLASVGRVAPGRFRPPFGPHAQEINAGPAPVDRRRITQPVEERLVQPHPDPSCQSIAHTPPTRRPAPAAELLGQQPPWAPRPQEEGEAPERGSVGKALSSTFGLGRLLGQQRLDGFPQGVEEKACGVHGRPSWHPAPVLQHALSHAGTTSGGADLVSITHSSTDRVSARRVGSTPDAESQPAMPALGSRSTSAIELAICFRF